MACRDALLASLAPAGLRPDLKPGPAPGGAVVWYLVEAFRGPGAEVWVVLDPSLPKLKQALGALDKRAAADATAAHPSHPETEPWEPPPPTSPPPPPPPPLPTPPDDEPLHVVGPAVPTNVAYL